MGYGLPETYGLSPLSQLRTGQKVWGIGNYGLSEGMGYGEFDCIRARETREHTRVKYIFPDVTRATPTII